MERKNIKQGAKMNVYGMTQHALELYFEGIGENPFKAGLVYDGIYKKGIRAFAEFGFADRITQQMERDLKFVLPEVVESSDGGDAAKLLLRLEDGEYVETVLMRQKFGDVLCVSTQVGCNMGCAFCQSGRLKKRRDLSAGEIVGQVMSVKRSIGSEIGGVSVMGIGEPFDNFGAVKDFCEIVSADKGLAVGRRHITVSTCGIVPKIYEYAALPSSYNLAISLHAPNDELRSRIMPVNKAYSLSEVLSAAEHFSEKTGRRVTLEYVMLGGVNDRPEHAEQLARLIGSRSFYVNIIPYNPTDNGFKKSAPEDIAIFYDILKKNGVVVTRRREFGAGLKAACGQLRADYL